MLALLGVTMVDTMIQGEVLIFHVEYQRDGEDFALDAWLPAKLHVRLERIPSLHERQALHLCSVGLSSIVNQERNGC